VYQLGPGLWPLSSHQGGRAGNKKSDEISITVRLEREMTLRNFLLELSPLSRLSGFSALARISDQICTRDFRRRSGPVPKF
jgi:hypothetical protein